MDTEVLRRRFTADEYQLMGKAGIFTEDDRVELIDGEIFEMSPIGNRHHACVDRLTRILVIGLGERAIVRVQGSFRPNQYSEPQSDIAVLRPRADFYASETAVAPDTLLVIEVAQSSLAFDRGIKQRLYARSEIRDYWIVDVNGDAVDVYRSPSGDAYAETRRAQRGGTVSPEAFPDLVIRVDDILG
jgi:Uma2 family endonuclease